MRGGVILALIVAVVAALIVAPLLSKASEYLASYRPAARKSVSVGEMGAGSEIAMGGANAGSRLRTIRHATHIVTRHIAHDGSPYNG